MSLPAAGSCLRIRSVAAAAPTATISRVSKFLRYSSSSISNPTPDMIYRTTLKLAKRRAQAYAFSSTASVRIVAVTEMQGQQAGVDTTASPASIPLTSSKSSAQSTSSLTWGSSSAPSSPHESTIPSAPKIEAEPIFAADDLSDEAYTERAKLLLSKRSLIEEAARVDHERATTSSSTASSLSASMFKVPAEEISSMLRKRISNDQEDESSERLKNSLAHNAGRAIRDKKLCGVVVSVGKMDRTVTVRFPRRDWSRKVKRHYTKPFNRLVHDPANAVRLGDVVSITLPPQGARQNLGNNVFHVVEKIVVPFGVPLEERPPVMSMVDLAMKWAAKIEARLERRRKRRVENRKAAKQGEIETIESENGKGKGEEVLGDGGRR